MSAAQVSIAFRLSLNLATLGASRGEAASNHAPGRACLGRALIDPPGGGNDRDLAPILGLALDQTENTGSRSVEGASQSFSYADTACEQLQKLLAKDFGYRLNGTPAERLAAIKKAQT